VLRRRLLDTGAVDAVIALGPSLFYTVTLPVMLWFFDRGKTTTRRKDRVLLIDARCIFRQVDRAHRDLAPEQIELLANVVRRHRGRPLENRHGGGDLARSLLGEGAYRDVPGLCKSATLREIERGEWSLHPGRHVGVAPAGEPDVDFDEKLATIRSDLDRLGAEARRLESKIAKSASRILPRR
jgi:type I restriction enzyme M protein